MFHEYGTVVNRSFNSYNERLLKITKTVLLGLKYKQKWNKDPYLAPPSYSSKLLVDGISVSSFTLIIKNIYKIFIQYDQYYIEL